ncbi:MAG: bifunctional (p)ppGpp synthetase/guanosine-3',5'-bis(diphosphate) 3'-pyrophosphohydrolase, partial [Lachnospiraceae bacterium]|nr:bifunctional (p)ppGpp synthetase/guanosine-3',5'-bis(diphosphate) 3'-pyrophosphohydrolase [Lachnospiraceae bacterium]
SIHSAVGNKMIGARVNGKLVPIDYRIQNGDRIEVLTSQNSKGPSRDWLALVKSTQAKNKINQWFKSEFKESNILKGKDMISQYCKMKSITLSDISKSEYQEKVMKKYGFRDWESVLAAIGHGGLKEGQVVNRLLEEHAKVHKKNITDDQVLENIIENKDQKMKLTKAKGGIVVKGIDDVAVRFSRCCNPVPGDEIVGFVTRGRGVSIHRTDCVNVLHMNEAERMRMIEAEWQGFATGSGEKYATEITIYANNRTGLLVDLSKTFTERGIDLTSINSRVSKQGTATISISFEISGTEELNRIVEKIRQIDSIIDIERAAT